MPFIYIQKPSGGGCAWDYDSDPVTRMADKFVPLPAKPSGKDHDGKYRELHIRIKQHPNTFMASASDLGSCVHPPNKSGYGARAARVALGALYRKDLEIYGPIYDRHLIENGTIRVTEAFTGLTVDDGVDAFEIGGTLTAIGDLIGDSGSITLNLVVENLNSSSLEQVWFEDFVIGSVETVASQIVSLAGRVYHSDHGYVDVTTDAVSALAGQYTIGAGVVAPFEVLVGDDNPSTGGLLLVGERGTAAIVRVIDTVQYDVVVDGGDLIFDATDLVLGPFNWD